VAKNNKPILSVLIDEDKRTKFADLARRHSLAMGWLVNQAIDKMIEADSIDVYRDSTHSSNTHISSVESIDIENIVKTSIDSLDIENMIKTSIANLTTPSIDIAEVENLVNISIDNRITPLTESVTELETYTQNQFKAVREELKKPLAIAR
jgi:hypothetical protein